MYGLIPGEWHVDIRMFTEKEFDSLVFVNGRRKMVQSKDINDKYNEDVFNPGDGELVKAADCLAAFIEAHVAIKNGSYSREFQEAKLSFTDMYGRAEIAGINFGEVYADFD